MSRLDHCRRMTARSSLGQLTLTTRLMDTEGVVERMSSLVHCHHMTARTSLGQKMTFTIQHMGAPNKYHAERFTVVQILQIVQIVLVLTYEVYK